MNHNLYVGGFPYQTTKEELAKLFSSCGTVTSTKIILDRKTGRPKGFGFIEMSTDAEARIAVEKLNGATLGTRKIFVVAGRPQDKRPGGFVPKPSFPVKPRFAERRSGKDRRQANAPKPASAPTPGKKWFLRPDGFEKTAGRNVDAQNYGDHKR